MAADKREDFTGDGAGVLDDDVAAAFGVDDMGDDERAAAGGGAEGEEGVKDVPGDAVLLGDKVGGVVLDVAGLAHDLGQEGDVRVPVELAQDFLHGSRHWICIGLFSGWGEEKRRRDESTRVWSKVSTE